MRKDRRDGYSPSDSHSDVDTRTRVGINMQVTEDVDGRLEFTRAGTGAGTTGTRYGASGSDGTSLNDEQDLIRVQNAYVNMALWNWQWRLGRQYVGDAGDLVWNIGPRSDDILSISSIDGLDVRRAWDRVAFDLFFGKAEENNPQGAANDVNEVSVKNLTVTFPGLVAGGDLWLGAIFGSNSNTNDTSDSTKLDIYRVGLRGGAAENFFTYRGEFLMNGGSDNSAVATGGQKIDYKGTALDLGVGLNLPETGVGQFALGANFLWASGDDDQTDDEDSSFNDLREVGVISGDRYYGEIFGRSNVLPTGTVVPRGFGADAGAPGSQILHLDALYKPSWATKSWWRLDFYHFGVAEDSISNGPGSSVQVDDYGTEMDLTAGYRHSDNVGFEAGFAWLMPDDGLNVALADGNTGDDDITKWFARMKIAWGNSQTAAVK